MKFLAKLNDFFIGLLYKLPVWLRFPMFGVLAFASFISFGSINDAWTDGEHFKRTNTILLVLGFFFAGLVVDIFLYANKQSEQIDKGDVPQQPGQ